MDEIMLALLFHRNHSHTAAHFIGKVSILEKANVIIFSYSNIIVLILFRFVNCVLFPFAFEKSEQIKSCLKLIVYQAHNFDIMLKSK